MPRKIRELLKDYKKAGAIVNESKGKGSHCKVIYNGRTVAVVSGKSGADAKPYQEKALQMFLDALR